MRRLKIAQLILPWMPLPPPGYAGTERVVYNLTEGLVKKGHDVTLFSVGESKTSAHLEFVFEKAFGLQPDVMQTIKSSFYPWIHVANCFEKQDQFDIIHSHAQFLALPFAAVSKTPSLHTFHRIFQFNAQDENEIIKRYGPKLKFTSISNAQRIPGVNFIATVYNGVNTNLFKPQLESKKDFIFWAGRIIDKKGPLEAIKTAKKINIPLILAGKITEPDYFETLIKPEIDNKLIQLVGELSEKEMIKLFQQAKVTIVPVKWNEPFGLIPVESMACGTPVVAYPNGGLRETVVDKITGFLVDEKKGVNGLVEKTDYILKLDKKNYQKMCIAARNHVVKNFSIEKMINEYEKIYYSLITSPQINL